MTHYAPVPRRPAPVDQEERELLVSDVLSEEELFEVWEHLISQPLISHHADATLGHLYDTSLGRLYDAAMAERKKR